MNEYIYVCKNDGCHRGYKMKSHLIQHERNCCYNNTSVDILLTQNKLKVEYNCTNNKHIESDRPTDLSHSGDCSHENPIVASKPKVLYVYFYGRLLSLLNLVIITICTNFFIHSFILFYVFLIHFSVYFLLLTEKNKRSCSTGIAPFLKFSLSS